MLIKGIDFPEALLRARLTGELVVFAGAGVSQPKPSSLPLFRELADRIAEHSGVDREEQEPDDRYLGRLRTVHEIKVHQKAAQILVGPHTKPHELHELLLKIFPAASSVRLVTTNFDTHFSTSAANAFDARINTFFAPALPLGHDFHGLVYLHGCAEMDPARCVLTDEDFGRAYLIDGWASRFLTAMFSRYTVLFVGYSHNDVVMNYIARGLPSFGGKGRFIFTPEDKPSNWKFVGINALSYKKIHGENKHQNITTSIQAWVTDLRSGFLDKAQRIRSIVESTPPLEGEDNDFLKFSLSDIGMARIFMKHAQLPAWINWLDKHGFSKPIFEPCGQLSQVEHELVHWFAVNFCWNHVHSFWAAIQRRNGRLHPYLCVQIWRQLYTRDRDDSKQRTFACWVAILIAEPCNGITPDRWALLLKGCRPEEDKSVAIRLFEQASKPKVFLLENYFALVFREGRPQLVEADANLPQVDFRLDLLRAEERELNEAWHHLFKRHINTYAILLEPVVTNNLALAHELAILNDKMWNDYDPFESHRPSITRDGSNLGRVAIDVLIDAAREILDHLIQTKPDVAMPLISRWSNSKVPILRRLAMNGYNSVENVPADSKMEWLLANRLAYRFKTDTFKFLQNSYPFASESPKRAFLATITRGPVGDPFDDWHEETRLHERHEWIQWLCHISPNCAITLQAMNELVEQHPELRQRRETEQSIPCEPAPAEAYAGGA